MNKIEELAAKYENHVSAPWQRTLSGAQRVTFVIYNKEQERILRARISEFAQATQRSQHTWKPIDCTQWFADWMGQEEYKDSYFEDYSLLAMKLDSEFRTTVSRRLASALEDADDNTVVGLLGIASLYGFVRGSDLIRSVEQSIKGRLVVFFPGTKDGNNYRLLDARDGWNYLAQSVTLHSDEIFP